MNGQLMRVPFDAVNRLDPKPIRDRMIELETMIRAGGEPKRMRELLDDYEELKGFLTVFTMGDQFRVICPGCGRTGMNHYTGCEVGKK